MLLTFEGVACLKCKFGVGLVSKELDCHETWTKLTSNIDKLDLPGKEKFLDLASKFQFGKSDKSDRKKRDTTDANSESAAAQQNADQSAKAEPEPEPESNEQYYCLKHSGIRGCAPKDKLKLAEKLCKKKEDGTIACACNDKDSCNSGFGLAGSMMVILLGLLPFV